MDFVLHGAIDGYFRLITLLECSTNIKVETAIRLFEQDIEIYGVPSRIRTDKGGKNNLIRRKIIESRGEGVEVILRHFLYRISRLNVYGEQPRSQRVFSL